VPVVYVQLTPGAAATEEEELLAYATAHVGERAPPARRPHRRSAADDRCRQDLQAEPRPAGDRGRPQGDRRGAPGPLSSVEAVQDPPAGTSCGCGPRASAMRCDGRSLRSASTPSSSTEFAHPRAADDHPSTPAARLTP
jgi:hypothetical protein